MPRFSTAELAAASLPRCCALMVVLVVCLPSCDADVTQPPAQAVVAENCGPSEGTCGVQLCDPDELTAQHVDVCSVIEWPSNPPTSGQHYPIWAAFESYAKPVPRGFWLHSAEHSGVVLAYNCELAMGDCQALIDELIAFAADQPDDDLCTSTTASVRHRIIVTPDPLLDVAVAAVAWGHSLKSGCFDPARTQAFVDAHYGNNYENFCTGGVDPTDPDEGFPANCGE